jgi:CheY-like chemotaxis protein
VIVVENGRAALNALSDGEPRPMLILLDLMMPTMDGFDFLVELRRNEQWRTIPVVVVTAKELTPDDHTRLNGFVRSIIPKAASTRQDLLNEVRGMVRARTLNGADAPQTVVR